MVMVLLISFFRGFGGNSILGINNCTGPWWGLTFAFVPIGIILLLVFANKLNKEYKHKKSIGFEAKQTSIEWN